MLQLSRKKIFLPIRPKPQLDISRRVLRGPDGKPLHVLGAFNAPMSIDSRFDRSSRHTVYVVRGLHTSLLGRRLLNSSKNGCRPFLTAFPASFVSSMTYWSSEPVGKSMTSDYRQSSNASPQQDWPSTVRNVSSLWASYVSAATWLAKTAFGLIQPRSQP